MPKDEKLVPDGAKPGDKIELSGQEYVVTRVRIGMLGIEREKPASDSKEQPKIVYSESTAPKLGRN